jgi:hypothetical protein
MIPNPRNLAFDLTGLTVEPGFRIFGEGFNQGASIGRASVTIS